MDLCDHSVVGCCTDIGLARAINADEGVTKASIALRLELYSDFLHALQLSDVSAAALTIYLTVLLTLV